MLYVTTREKKDAYTSYRAMCEDVGPDGGRYVPFSLPQLTQEELDTFREKSFSKSVAEILNRFFSSGLNGWDIDFCVGRNPIRLAQMNHRIVIAELWHNLHGNYSYLVNNLCKKIFQDTPTVQSNWMKIAIKIAVLFGVYSELLRSDVETAFDVSVLSGDFSSPIAVYYAKKMGLPVGNIICTCIEGSTVWDFIHRGTFTPAGTKESLQLGLERLILDVFGVEEVIRFADCCNRGVSYTLDEEQLPLLSKGFFSTVAGDSRASSVISSLYRTNNYVSDAKTALCFGGLQDYRARTGESQLTLLLSEETPLHSVDEIAKIIGAEKDRLEQLINS